jgi:ethanolamine utilization protein EutA
MDGNGGYHGHSEEHEGITRMPLEEEHPMLAGERIELTSAGIDIGTTTSHLMFSEIVLRRQGISLSSRFQIVSKKVVYESRILLTPFIDNRTIDAKSLSTFIAEAYANADIIPEQIDTGAVIITGEAARKDNAEAIAGLFSVQAGEFVCATAGANLEAKMAAYGAGAVGRSSTKDGQGSTIMNVDVGGGTAKIAVAYSGSMVDTAAINVGARLVSLDDSGQVVHMEDSAKLIAEHLGLTVGLGSRLGRDKKEQLARAMVGSLFEVIGRGKLSPLTQRLMITPPLSFSGEVDAIMFSGGVSEYIYGFERGNYGDLGEIVAQEIRQRTSSPDFNIPVNDSAERIRATVIGASQYTVQVSGSTVLISDDKVLPLRNLQVVTLQVEDSQISAERIESALRESFRQADINPMEKPIAVAVHWPFEPSYRLIKALATGITSALTNAINQGMPLILIFDADIGKLVGNMLKQELGLKGEVVSIDGIQLQDFDYVDIGEWLPHAPVVPVVIKSLVFRTGA